MKFCASIIKSKLDFTEKIKNYSKHGTRRRSELSKMCDDYSEAYAFLNGNIDAVSFVPTYSISSLKRQLVWLNYAPELHADAIEEIYYCINKMKLDGIKGLSDRHSESSS